MSLRSAASVRWARRTIALVAVVNVLMGCRNLIGYEDPLELVGADGAPASNVTGSRRPTFTDRFDRADGPTIGNGWIEKADHFSISNGEVLQTGSGAFTDCIVLRPATEPALDVELSVDFTFAASAPLDSETGLYARVQPDAVKLGTLIGYSLYLYRDAVEISRQDAEGAAVREQEITPLLAGRTYHLVFRVIGTNPVELQASVFEMDGTTLASLGWTDDSLPRIVAPGQIGFGSGNAAQGRWNNFTRIDL